MQKTRKDIYNHHVIYIPKSKNKFRKIYIANGLLAERLQTFHTRLKEIYDKHKVYDCDHAFFPGRNCVTNAREHIKNRYVLTVDLENFFDTLNNKHLEKRVPKQMLSLMIVDNHVPQGFSTSPYLANIAMIDFDKYLFNTMVSLNKGVVYTRYADDLTFSFNDKALKEIVLSEIAKICHHFGFKIHPKKTRFQDKHNGRAIITGVGVSMYNVHPTRSTIKRLRAARHQNNEDSAQGLAEWVLCKTPKNC